MVSTPQNRGTKRQVHQLVSIRRKLRLTRLVRRTCMQPNEMKGIFVLIIRILKAVIGAVASFVFKERRIAVKCALLAFMTHANELMAAQFKLLYRMNFNDFVTFRNIIAPGCQCTQRSNVNISPAVTPYIMLCVILRLLAVASCLDVSWPYCIAISTVYYLFDETPDLLCKILQHITYD